MWHDREEAVRLRAYAIWQDEGCPHGRDLVHWHQAERETAAEPAGGPMAAPDGADGSDPVLQVPKVLMPIEAGPGHRPGHWQDEIA